MLLFIGFTCNLTCFSQNFNTSHVTVYRRYSNRSKKRGSDFNTSHVTVYRTERLMSGVMCKFQYISCYCLSPCGRSLPFSAFISIHLMLLFINISPVNLLIRTHFNTSHVTVYRYTRSSPTSSNLISIHLMLLFIFQSYHSLFYSISISIHLMLLFIDSAVVITEDLYRFQYISCYCLSYDTLRI